MALKKARLVAHDKAAAAAARNSTEEAGSETEQVLEERNVVEQNSALFHLNICSHFSQQG